MDYLPSGVAVATNGVKIRYAGATLIAQRALVNQKTGKTVAEGEVRIEHEGQVWAGERIEYNFLTHKMVTENFKAGQNPFCSTPVPGSSLDCSSSVRTPSHWVYVTAAR